MAAEEQTFTVDTSVPTETLGSDLTADEADSLKVGEELAEQQEQLLAGKYKDAAELEKAYKELEAKLGETETETEETESEPETEETTLSETASLITEASDEYYSNDGKLSPETMEKFKGMSSEELLNAYIEVTNNPQWSGNLPSQVEDVTESQINEVKNFAGGDQAYSDMVQWAGKNLDQKTISTFDDIITKGNIDAIKFAVQGLKSQYLNAVGFEGNMVQGKAPQG